MIVKGKNRDTAWFSMLDSEWPARKAGVRTLACAGKLRFRRATESKPGFVHGERALAMAGRLTGKTAVITAAGQGIGRAIAEAFAAEGAQVIATDLDAGKLSGLAAARLLRLDVRSTEAVDALARDVERDFGGADILVNCAGFVHHGTVLDCTDADWDFSFDLNVKSMHRTIRAFLPAMLKKERGSIVNISSVASSITGLPNRYVYGASKAAVIGLTKAVAADFIKQGIRCNAICPGTIESPSLEQRIETLAANTGQSLEAARQSFVDRQPMGRLGHGTGGRCARTSFSLPTSRCYITGQPHLVDGGLAL